MFIESTTLIIPTKDRIDYLDRLFKSIKNVSIKFSEILIIDSSNHKMHESIKSKFSNLKNIKVYKCKPSISIQRNMGIENMNKNIKHVMFCDDDVIFEDNAFQNMNIFINENPKYLGYGFNLINKESKEFLQNFKKNRFLSTNGFYNSEPGIVCENGWHTKNSNMKNNQITMWLSTQACIFKANEIKDIKFEIDLGRYSYLEDLFFSYEINKKGKMIVVSEARYNHPDFIERKSFEFGIQEVVNRYKFVKKNNLNTKKFYITVIFKSLHNLSKTLLKNFKFFHNFVGNLYGILKCLLKL